MDESNKLFILLHIERATGLNNIENNPIILIATLCGNILESEIVQPGEIATTFDNNLVWETDKRSMKRMKSENVPIKLECFIISNQGDQRQYIGYVIIPIRVIPIVVGSRSERVIKSRWYKFIGFSGTISHWNKQKPEILMSVVITDNININLENDSYNLKNSTEPDLIVSPSKSHKDEQDDNQIEKYENMLSSQNGLFIKLLQNEGLLQIGDSTDDCHIFIVKIIIKNAINLERINEIQSNNNNNTESTDLKYTMKYILFGNSNEECLLTKQSNDIHSIQEIITINFRSSLKMLKKYFQYIFSIPIEFYCNDLKIGKTTLKLMNAISTIDLNKFLLKTISVNGIEQLDGKISIDPIQNSIMKFNNLNSYSYIDYKFILKYSSTCENLNLNLNKIDINNLHNDPIKRPPPVHEFYDGKGGGDHHGNIITTSPKSIETNITMDREMLCTTMPPTETAGHIQMIDEECQVNMSEDKKQRTTVNVDVGIACDLIKNYIDLPQQQQQTPKIKMIPKTFSYVLVLKSIRFNRKPDVGIWQISLQHTKADTPFTIINLELNEIQSELIDFENLELILYFSSDPKNINEIIESEPCVLNIKGPHSNYATAELDNGHLLAQANNAGIILMENQNCEKIAMCCAYVYLEDLGANYNNQIKKFRNITNDNNLASSPQKIQLDKELTYKLIEELEQWKLNQQELFLIELKRREINHLKQLTNDWQQQKLEKEKCLAEKLEKCSLLTIALEEAQKTLKEKGIEELQRERILERAKIELEKTYSQKLLKLREMARRLEDDSIHRIKLEEIKFKELEMTTNLLQKENIKLKENILELENHIKNMKKNFIAKEQLIVYQEEMKLLHEKLEMVEKAKLFYKQEWAKNIQEVHKMKSEQFSEIDCQIKHKIAIGIDELLDSERNDLYADKRDLKIIKEVLELSTSSSS